MPCISYYCNTFAELCILHIAYCDQTRAGHMHAVPQHGPLRTFQRILNFAFNKLACILYNVGSKVDLYEDNN